MVDHLSFIYSTCTRNLYNKTNISKLNSIQTRNLFEFEVDQILKEGILDSLDDTIKNKIKLDLLSRYDFSQHSKAKISNMDMMTKNLKCNVCDSVRDLMRSKRLYQELDDLVYDFGGFHVFYTLRCLFMDKDEGKNINHIARSL